MVVNFSNTSSVDHNLVFIAPLTARSSAIVAPGAAERIELDGPAAGQYRFVCTIHEGMQGTLIVD